ncbi:MAG: MjaI family restriction endonuclease [bacterium]
MIIKVTDMEINQFYEISDIDLPKYVSQILNLANQNAQGTRPSVVGQLSELIQEFTGTTLEEWEKWYLTKQPEALKNSTEKITAMILNLKDAMNKITDEMIQSWVKDLVIVKTFVGLKYQEAILKKCSEIMKKPYRLATPEEESRGIDGFIETTPYSIKPITYKTMKSLSEKIDVKIIYYEKKNKYIEIEFN